MGEPTGLIATSGIELLTWGTPNGYKVSILLEELKEAYGGRPEYVSQAINISKNTQKEPWFTALNPNGRIPVIIDHDRDGLPVFEGIAILGYLTRHYDPDHHFSFPVDSDDYTICEEWIGWQHGGLGPMQGQANHFLRYAKEKVPYGIQRYTGETERLYGILDKRLEDRDYVAGPGRGKYSIADMSLLGWVNIAQNAGLFDFATQFPHVAAWYERLIARPATARGLAVPGVAAMAQSNLPKRLAGDEGFKEREEGFKKLLDAAKAQYGYKYASP